MDPHSAIAKLEASIEKAIISQASASASASENQEVALNEGLRERVAEVAREADKAGPPTKPE